MNYIRRVITISTLFGFFNIFSILNAQPNQVMNSSEIQAALEKLKVLGSVLYIGAHPDDENTGLLAYLSKGRKYRTAYLSLTRGDGGQNLIGPEIGNAIGIIRTQELLEARKIDGSEQYFTRAVDFGYSKSSDESLTIWDKETVLADVVWVIRNFKPDVIISRFPLDGGGGHGHHTASALLASEAFSAAADSSRYPEQLKYVQPWSTKRLFWNSWQPSQSEVGNLVSVDVGEFNSLLGKSYAELAAESRSMHKSQGFGTTAYRGSRMEYFRFITGEPAKEDIFDGINTTWARFEGGAPEAKKIQEIIYFFNPGNPSASLNQLTELYQDLTKLKSNYWVDVKKNELLNIIKSCAGLWIEAIASDYSAAPGEEININTSVLSRSESQFKIDKIELPSLQINSTANSKLENNRPVTIEKKIIIPQSYPVSQPYWLVEESSKELFKVSEQELIGLAENPPSVPINFILDYNGTKLTYSVPLLYRWNDRVHGELYRPFEIRPPATVNFSNNVLLFSDNNSKEIQLRLKANAANINGEINLAADGNWEIIPSKIPFSIMNKYDEQLITVKIIPPKDSSEAVLNVELDVNGRKFNKSHVEISYPHIKHQVYFPKSEIKLVKVDLVKYNNSIGYVMGSGDEIPDCLLNIGYNVTLLSDELLEKLDLSQFDVIITGIRAYNTRSRLKHYQPKLLDYVNNGGTLIAQYNVISGLLLSNIGPYSLKIGNGRITAEDAPINFKNPEHQLLNFPNKITKKDFDGWVQERGLYFAEQWDEKYRSILSGSDRNEKELEGGLLFTRYGNGIFMYTGFSWFRQLPAGVPGAYRIFVNMISAGNNNGKSPN